MEAIRGKVAFITGGAGVIGLTMVKELLKGGIRGVAIIDQFEEYGEKAISELSDSFGNNRAIFIKTDITNRQQLERAFETTIQTFNQLDIVINNAAIINESDWKKMVTVNFTALTEGTYLAMQKYLFKHKSGNEGIIVNIASDLGFNSLNTLPVYSATKHAIVGLGQALGSEDFYQKYQTRVLTICPSAVNTPLITEVNDSRFWFADKMAEELEKTKNSLISPDHVGKSLIEVIKKGENGSLWVVEKDDVYQVVVPHIKLMKVDK